MLREQDWLHPQREPSQTFESWVRTVKEKAKACKFDSVDITVRDKLVFSCRGDASTLKSYDVSSGLTLRKTIEILSMRESTKKELAGAKAATVYALTARPKAEQNRKNRSSPTRTRPKYCRPSGGSASTGTDEWSYCHRKHLSGQKNCPAKKTNCRKCSKVGHFAVVCRSSPAVREILQDDVLGEDDCFVGGVRDKSTLSTNSGWHIKLKFGSQELNWCIDTGVRVSVMPDHIFKSTFGTLHSPDSQLLGPGDQRLDVKGFAFMKLTHRQTCIQEKSTL